VQLVVDGKRYVKDNGATLFGILRGTSAGFRPHSVPNLLFLAFGPTCHLDFNLHSSPGDLGYHVLGLTIDGLGIVDDWAWDVNSVGYGYSPPRVERSGDPGLVPRASLYFRVF
jgi:hypothetical protein